MKCRLSWSAALTAALLLSGCAALEWHRDGATAEDTERDVAACTSQARQDALHRTPLWWLPAPPLVVDRHGRMLTAYPYRRDYYDRFLIEQDLQRACLQQRGYALREMGKSAP